MSHTLRGIRYLPEWAAYLANKLTSGYQLKSLLLELLENISHQLYNNTNSPSALHQPTIWPMFKWSHTRFLTARATCFCLCPLSFAAQLNLPESQLAYVDVCVSKQISQQQARFSRAQMCAFRPIPMLRDRKSCAVGFSSCMLGNAVHFRVFPYTPSRGHHDAFKRYVL